MPAQQFLLPPPSLRLCASAVKERPSFHQEPQSNRCGRKFLPSRLIPLARGNDLPENSRVQIRFLLGPAGTGKTFRCLEEIRAELLRDPQGAPLLFLAPKQATFQIERQLLADGELAGYTRLQILSFDRLAEFFLEALGRSSGEILSEEGRVMILRALLAQHGPKLQTFHATARLPGFAQQLAGLLRELQHQQIAPERLQQVSAAGGINNTLQSKLQDVALLHAAYREWLRDGELEDADSLLEVAAESLQEARAQLPRGMHLWLDGFSEMTPQELNLLAAILPCCESATLAFCLEDEARAEPGSWLSLWTVVGQTYRAVRQRVDNLPGVNVIVETLPRVVERNRFSSAPLLGELEAGWAGVAQPLSTVADQHELRLVACASVEAEAVFAAREILQLVRARGGRYRDCAVLMRNFTGYHDTVRRVFTRFGIPIFLDRREPVTHHPLAELTRFALRVAAYGWRREDWFGALKTGLVERDDESVDRLENEALARGWEREHWLQPLPLKDGEPHRFEPLRARVTPPFEKLTRALTGSVSGPQLAAAVRALWVELHVESTLEDWSVEARAVAPLAGEVHGSVQEQILLWLENVERAFAASSLPLVEWLPILESGLAGLKLGVIPPALDQVLVGTIDRSRNPDLRLVVVIGMNETVFPALPPPPLILTEREREEFSNALVRGKKSFGLSQRDRIAHERFYGYIACTRSRERLVLTWATADHKGRALNPSPFIGQITRQLPQVVVETFSQPDWRDAEHAHEIAPEVIASARAELLPLRDWPEFRELVARADGVRAAANAVQLAAGLAEHLYANPFRTSVSKLEQFAACPFKFFLSAGLGMKEREEHEVDARETGSFQHEILSTFHQRATQDGRRWRDWPPEDAAQLVREIGEEQLRSFGHGLFAADAAREFAARLLIENLAGLIRVLVDWMKQYQFDPRAVELSFGLPDSTLPGWAIDLGDGKSLLLGGRVDRVDLCARPGAEGEPLAVVIDYKSSGRKLDNVKLFHGLELQLLSYLGWLRQADPSSLGAARLVPAGVFYVGLREQAKSASSREDALEDADAIRRKAFQHTGRFDETWLDQLAGDRSTGQFNLRGRSDACDPATFAALVADVEKHLRDFGRQVLSGAIQIAPYQKGQEVACDRCEFQSVCRFDPWTQPYRPLKAPPKPPKPEKTPTKRSRAT